MAIDPRSWSATAESCRTRPIATAMSRCPDHRSRQTSPTWCTRLDRRGAQRGAGRTRRPGQPCRVASSGVRPARRRPLHPDLQPRIRRGGLGDLAQPVRRCLHPCRPRRPCGLTRSGLRDWLVTEGITVTFLPTPVAEGVIGLDWPDDGALRYLLTGGDALTRRPRPDLGFTWSTTTGSARPRWSLRRARSLPTATERPRSAVRSPGLWPTSLTSACNRSSLAATESWCSGAWPSRAGT